MSATAWEFWIDRGGTFTDVVGRAPGGALHVEKLLSEAPGYADAAVEGVRRVLARCGAKDGTARVAAVKMGTTVATNALLERRGEPTLLAVTAGHADALTIGWQARPRLFELDIRKAPPLHAEALEIAERVTAEGEVLRPLDEAAARAGLQAAHDRGLRAVAVVLVHGHAHPAHEARVAAIAREVGFTQVSASHEVAPLIKLIPRGDTAVVDAYLSPVLHRYVGRLTAELRAVPGCAGARVLFMQSSGGLTEAGRVRGKDAVLSGPAGGVVGLAAAAAGAGFGAAIGFDMGGTSTDVSRWAGSFERAAETEVAGVRLRAPVMSLHTVAAGGGSICRWDGARLRVGPQSAGADPGPAAYRRGGPLTVTDANFLLGRLQPGLFPAVFGPCADQPPDAEVVRRGFIALAAEVEATTGRPTTPEALAEGCLAVAVEHMAQAVRRISVAKGYDAAAHVLVSFGGAGGQHACRVAEALGIGRVLLHPLAGVLSAWGMGLAERREVRERTAGAPLTAEGWPGVERLAAALGAEARAALAGQGVTEAQVSATVGCRYAGVDATLPVPLEGGAEAMRDAFHRLHARRFGFSDPEREVVAETVTAEAASPPERPDAPAPPAVGADARIGSARLWVDGAWCDAPVHDRARLGAGAALKGPALVREDTGMLVLEPGWRLEVTDRADLVLTRVAGAAAPPRSAPGAGAAADPVKLELYASRFMAVAEQMGAALQNTAASVNIKERLDFSCAVFDAAGALIANAPHMPVHLGSMGDSVRAVVRARAADGRPFRAGDAWMLNDPSDGGTHLPDVTVVAPVSAPGAREGDAPFAFVAARGHQADIGGITPGSMPPLSRTLAEEGVLIRDVLLVEGDGAGGGRLREAQVRALLACGPHPARNPDQNLADLRAQVAACARGASELRALAAAEGTAAVSAYMEHLQAAAAESVRRALDRLQDGAFAYETDAGAVVRVAVRVDRSASGAARRATVDFTGTSGQLATNFNAPRGVARAAVLYVFRCLVDDDIPLNDGCLRPLEIVIPEGSMLSPAPGAAVVAGNVETSQVVVDALLGALGVVAASQGTMNNLTFGDASAQYYETICGGAGAGPGFDGACAVQTHMTNSRLTDPEILETRFPVILDRFAIRRGSGGEGAHRGGDGVERRLVFRRPMTVSILADRRRVPPYGAAGGAPGKVGATRVERADGRAETLASTQTVELAAGDAVVVETPGGGGWGARQPAPEGGALA